MFNKPRVLSKYFTSQNSISAVLCSEVLFVLFAFAFGGFAQEKAPSNRFLGANSCSSSSCHGGGAAQHNECIVWAKKDFHSRSFATITTARSARMAEVLKMESPASNASCTICHAPFQTVPANQQLNPLDHTAGVSCESCHAPAENWLRRHTRPDFTHEDRVAAGLRDLKNLYVRASSCVACHQNISSNLLAAGHPELIFELDGQGVSEPKHWRESTHWNGAQTWLVGQAVALREMSWELSKAPKDEKLRHKWNGLLWVLEQVSGAMDFPAFNISGVESDFAQAAQQRSDELARKVSGMNWSPGLTQKILSSLAGASGDFKTKDLAQAVLARRAERLVLGLDRLVVASDKKLKLALDSELNGLYSLIQSLPDFNPSKFADALEKFRLKQQELR